MAPNGIIKTLRSAGLSDSVGKRKNGNIIFRDGYYFRHGNTSEKMAKFIKRKLLDMGFDERTFDMVGNGDHWAPFQGNQTISQGSHFWVEVKFL